MKKTRQRDLMLLMTTFVLMFSMFNTGKAFADDSVPPTEPVATEESSTDNAPDITAEPIVIDQSTQEPSISDVPIATSEPIVMDQSTEVPVASDASDVTVEPIVIDEPNEIPTSEGTSTETVDQPLSEILDQLPEDTQLIILDENGVVEHLVTQNAAEIIATSDPIWCPAGQTPGGAGCTAGYASAALLISALNGVTGNGTIYFTPIYSTNDLTFDHTNANLSGLDALTIQGGWNGSTGNAFELSGSTTFTGVGLNITNWTSDVTINDIIVDGSPTSIGIDVITAGDIILSNVTTIGNVAGASLDNCVWFIYHCIGTGDITMTGTNTFNNNINGGLQVSSNGSMSLNNITASDNGSYGANLNSHGSIILTGNNTFNNNHNLPAVLTGTGLSVTSFGDINLNNITAYNNAQVGLAITNYLNQLDQGNTTITCGTISGNGEYDIHTYTPGTLILNGLTINGSTEFGGGGTQVNNPFDCNPKSSKKPVMSGPSLPENLVNITSGQEVDLDCKSYGGMKLVLPNGASLFLPCPVGDSASLTDNQSNSLPSSLPEGNVFQSSITTTVTEKGENLGKLSKYATISFAIPEGVDPPALAILYWDGTKWVEVNTLVAGNGSLEAYVNYTGTFALVVK